MSRLYFEIMIIVTYVLSIEIWACVSFTFKKLNRRHNRRVRYYKQAIKEINENGEND